MGANPPPQQNNNSPLVAFIQHLFSGTNPDTIIPAAIIVGAVIVAVLARQTFPAWAVVTFGVIIAILTLVPQYLNFVRSRDDFRIAANNQQNQNFLAININVLDSKTDNPVGDADVALLVAQRVSSKTNPNGLAVLSVPGAFVQAGRAYEMIVAHPDYEREKREVTLTDGFSDWVRLVPAEKGAPQAAAVNNTPETILTGVPMNALPPRPAPGTVDRQVFSDVVNFITPYVQSTGTRRALVLEAFWDEAIVNQLNFSGSAYEFASELISKADDYNDNEAIVQILLALRNDVGTNKQREIDSLVSRLRGDTTA